MFDKIIDYYKKRTDALYAFNRKFDKYVETSQQHIKSLEEENARLSRVLENLSEHFFVVSTEHSRLCNAIRPFAKIGDKIGPLHLCDDKYINLASFCASKENLCFTLGDLREAYTLLNSIETNYGKLKIKETV